MSGASGELFHPKPIRRTRSDKGVLRGKRKPQTPKFEVFPEGEVWCGDHGFQRWSFPDEYEWTGLEQYTNPETGLMELDTEDLQAEWQDALDAVQERKAAKVRNAKKRGVRKVLGLARNAPVIV